MLQIMFQTQEQLEASRMEDTQETTQNSSVLSGNSGNAPLSSPFAMSVTVIEARDMPNNAAGEATETFACVSLMENPAEIEDRHFHLIGHDLANGNDSPHLMRVQPLHWGRVGPRSHRPVWNDSCTLTTTHPGPPQLDQLHKDGNLSTSRTRVAIDGKPLAFFVTVHDRDAFNEGADSFVGRVVLPEIESGKPVDQWFMLQTQDGTPIVGSNGRTTEIHIQIVYARASTLPSSGAANTAPHAAISPQVQAVSHPRPTRASAPLGGSSALSGASVNSEDQAKTRFAFHLEIVEARNLSTVAGQSATSPFVAVSLVVEPEQMQETDFYLIDHNIGNDVDETQLYCLSPICRSGAAEKGGAAPVWTESYTVYGAHASIRRISELHAQDNLQTTPERIELQGQPLLLLATVHDESPDGPVFCGRFLIPQVDKGTPVDQWFKLHDREGAPVVGEVSGQPASIRLRFAYGAVRSAPPASATSDLARSAEPDTLSPGWERKVDPSGRPFYVNHSLRTFSWTPPPPVSATPAPLQPAPALTSPPSPEAPPVQAAPSLHPPTVEAPTVEAQPSTVEARPTAPAQPPPHPPSPPQAPASYFPPAENPVSQAPSQATRSDYELLPEPPQPRGDSRGDSPSAETPAPHAPPNSEPYQSAPQPQQARSEYQPRHPLQQIRLPEPGEIERPVVSAHSSAPPPPDTPPPPKCTGFAIPGAVCPPKPSMHQARVYVTVAEGRGLPVTDAHGACDAFVEVVLEASGYELAYGRTSACPNTVSPVWNEQLTYGVDAEQVSAVPWRGRRAVGVSNCSTALHLLGHCKLSVREDTESHTRFPAHSLRRGGCRCLWLISV